MNGPRFELSSTLITTSPPRPLPHGFPSRLAPDLRLHPSVLRHHPVGGSARGGRGMQNPHRHPQHQQPRRHVVSLMNIHELNDKLPQMIKKHVAMFIDWTTRKQSIIH